MLSKRFAGVISSVISYPDRAIHGAVLLPVIGVLSCVFLLSPFSRRQVTDPSIKPYYACKLSPRVGFFMTDNRVERSLHK